MRATDPRPRSYVGADLRRLRTDLRIPQRDMSRRLGVSLSYLSQLENDRRPLTKNLADRISEEFPLDWTATNLAEQRRIAVAAMFRDPLFSDLSAGDRVARDLEQFPALVDYLIRANSAWRQVQEDRHIADEALANGVASHMRLQWEEVRDWFHDAGNYVDRLDRLAEELSHDLAVPDRDERDLAHVLSDSHGVQCVDATGPDADRLIHRYDAERRTLTLGRGLPTETRRFILAHRLTMLCFADDIASIAHTATPMSDDGKRLMTAGLANYAASALLMPYGSFRTSAREFRHDIDRMRQRYRVSFEQACHRLSTLQRPGQRGVPVFFCRIDMAGNITKRHSATRLQFARFGGACPLWIVHEAVAIPDRILVQLAQTPDGVRYVSMAKGLVKPSGSFKRPPRRYAVALGCEAEHAREFVYADDLDLAAGGTPIGVSCRLCPRADCEQRAFPPSDRPIEVALDRRDTVPYSIT